MEQINKEQLLEGVKSLAEANQLTKQELIDAYEQGINKDARHPDLLTSRLSISTVLYYIGGLIAFMGIAALVSLNWENLNSASRILITLGTGIATYVAGALFSREERTESLAQAFFLIACLTLPVGIGVTIEQLGNDSMNYQIQSIVAALASAVFIASYWIYRKYIFSIFEIAYLTWLYFAFTAMLLENSQTTLNYLHILEYRVLIAGACYLLLAQYFVETHRSALAPVLRFFGLVAVFGAIMALGGFKPDQNIFYELLFPLLAFGAIFGSIYLHSKAYLFLGAIALIGYIIKITAEYFSAGFGWPIALIIAGLLMIGVGQFTVYMNKRYKQITA